MDPYLEQPNFWSSFHFRLIGAIAAALTPQLSDQYYIEVELRTYQTLITQPETVMLPMTESVKERYLEIRDSQTDAVITVIEVLSPKNKQAGEGRNAYEKKRRSILGSATHLVEIDLIRAGKAMPIVSNRPPSAYRILISRSPQRPAADLYALSLQTPLPTIPIPLKPNDADIILDLQALFDQIYTEARYGMRLDYREPVPPPALLADDRQWLETIH